MGNSPAARASTDDHPSHGKPGRGAWLGACTRRALMRPRFPATLLLAIFSSSTAVAHNRNTAGGPAPSITKESRAIMQAAKADWVSSRIRGFVDVAHGMIWGTVNQLGGLSKAKISDSSSVAPSTTAAF